MSTDTQDSVSTHTRQPDGALIFWRDRLGRVELPPVPVDRYGAHRTLVYPTQHGGDPITRGRVKWDNLRARHELAQHCLAADDATVHEWLKLFVYVATVLEEGESDACAALPPWPRCRLEAYYGIVGDVVKTVAPCTEADPVAILVQALVIAGAMVGGALSYQIGATRHTPRDYTVIVGRTGSGRKGTGLDIARWLFNPPPTEDGADATRPFPTSVKGCGSGEGLIYAVRDPSYRLEPIRGETSSRGRKGPIIGYERVMVDEGVQDKRIIIEETEFAGVLHIARREHNTLSMILRQLWETGDLHNTVKNNPIKATGAHGVLIGHITPEELRTALTTVEVSNGLANRFLWVCAAKTQDLPAGDELSRVDFGPFRRTISATMGALETASARSHEMHRSNEASAMWSAVYPVLSRPFPGLLGAVLGRSVAHVLRLSMLYALLDRSVVIEPAHLIAALALWEYCEASAAYLFGTDATGSDVLDRILEALAEAREQGLTRDDLLRHVLQRHVSSRALTGMLHDLHTMGLITMQDEPRRDGRPGRSRQRVLLREPERCDSSDIRSGRNYIAIAKQLLGGN